MIDFRKYHKYIRHIILKDIGFLNQDILEKSKILCVGAGGLGSPAIIYLLYTGIKNIGIIDFAAVSESNLNRQIIFNQNDVGKKKIFCVKKYIKKLNKKINLKTYDFKLSNKNCVEIFKNYDLILDCSDNLETKFLINDFSSKLDIPFIHGSVYGFEGYIAIFSKKYGCYRCLFDNAKNISNLNHGIMGQTAGIIGILQSLIAIIFLLNKNNSNFIKNLCLNLLTFDFKNLNFGKFLIKKKKKCKICL